eukprot:gene11107-biopygen7195
MAHTAPHGATRHHTAMHTAPCTWHMRHTALHGVSHGVAHGAHGSACDSSLRRVKTSQRHNVAASRATKCSLLLTSSTNCIPKSCAAINVDQSHSTEMHADIDYFGPM